MISKRFGTRKPLGPENLMNLAAAQEAAFYAARDPVTKRAECEKYIGLAAQSKDPEQRAVLQQRAVTMAGLVDSKLKEDVCWQLYSTATADIPNKEDALKLLMKEATPELQRIAMQMDQNLRGKPIIIEGLGKQTASQMSIGFPVILPRLGIHREGPRA